MEFATPAWDLALFRLVNEGLHSPLLDWPMRLASSPALLWGVVLLGLFAGLRRHGRAAQLGGTLVIVLALGVADGGTNLLKDAHGRIRPLNALPEVHFVEDGQWQQRPADFTRTKPHGNSYPSAHAANSMAAAVVIAFLWRGTRRYVWLLPLVTGFSRIYLGKHYPVDVLMGWTFGLGAACLVLALTLLLRPDLHRLRLPHGR